MLSASETNRICKKKHTIGKEGNRERKCCIPNIFDRMEGLVI